MLEYGAIARRITDDGARTVLDWGAGWGQVSQLLAGHGLDVSSFDYREEGPEATQAMERYPELEVRLSSDPVRLPYPDEQFDAVLSCGVLEHVAFPAASLAEVRRVLNPGGTVYVYKLPNRTSYLEAIARVMGLYYHGKLPHDRLYTRRSAVALLEMSGFEIVEAELANMLPLTVGDGLSNRHAPAIWRLNRRLAAVPALRGLATNVNVIARKAGVPSAAAG